VADSLKGDSGRKRTFITDGNSETCGEGIGRSSMKSIGTETKHSQTVSKDDYFQDTFS
jgi:hypothetical protein